MITIRPFATLLWAIAIGTSAQAAPFTIDFNSDALGSGISAGQVLDDEFSPWGITLRADNNRSGHPDMAIAFDSANPTGGDGDLRTPGGGLNNTTPLGMVIIIAEDSVDRNSDGFIDDPDDEARGGTIFFHFNQLITASGWVTMVDIEEHGGSIDLLHNGSIVNSVSIPGLGDNSVQDVVFNQTQFDELRVNLVGSGAVGALTLDSTTGIPEPASLAVMALGVALIARRTR